MSALPTKMKARESRSRGFRFLPAVLRLWMSASLLFAGLPLPVQADAPLVFNYQGKLADSGGAPQSGSFTMLFNIYAQPSGGSAISTYAPFAAVGVVNGLFNVLVGDTGAGSVTGQSLTQALTGGTDRYLEVVINGAPLSRHRLAAAPFAMGVADNAVADKEVAAGAGIAYSKLNLSGSLVNGDLAGGAYSSITGVGTVVSGVWNGSLVDVAHGGTGAAAPPSALASLGAAASTTTFTAGTGLTGGGTLDTDRSFSLITTGGLTVCTSSTTQKLYWDGTNGRLACGTDFFGGGGTVNGTGIANRAARWSAVSTVTVSGITDDGTTVGFPTPVSVTGNLTASSDLSATGALSGTSLSLTTPLGLGSGGTGAGSLAAGGILMVAPSSVTATGVLSNGQILIGNGAGTPSPGTISGTANRVNVVNGAGTITLSTPQNLHAAATPSFSGLTLSAPLGAGSGGTGLNTLPAHGVILGNAAGAVNVSTTGVAGDVFLSPVAAADPRWGRIANGNLATGSFGNITGVGTITSGIWNGTAIAPNHGGTGQAAVTGGNILFGSAANVLSRLALGSAGQVLTVSGGLPSWQAPGVLVSGGGTVGTIPRWSGATALTDSILTDNGTTATVGGNLSANSLTLTAPLSVANGGTGLAAYTAGNFINASGAAALQQRTPAQMRLDIVAASTGTNTDITSLTGLSAPLPPTKGGTGLSAASLGDLLVGSGSNIWSTLPIGATGRVLTVSGGIPAWLPPQAASGSGTAGQGAFWNSVNATSLTGDGGFIWDNINKRLGIGAAPSWPLQVTSASNPTVTLTTTSSGDKRTRLLFMSQQTMASTGQPDLGWELGRDLPFNGTDDMYLFNDNTGATDFVMESNGNVGIGIQPSQTLHNDAFDQVLTTGAGAGLRFRERNASTSADDWEFLAFQDTRATTRKGLLNAARYSSIDPTIGGDPNLIHAVVQMEQGNPTGHVCLGALVTDSNSMLKIQQIAGLDSAAIDLEAGGGTAIICNGTCEFSSMNGGAKTFVIPHPSDRDRFLVHATLEGPEGAVSYHGTARLTDGRAWVALPDYFEALTRLEGRTVQLVPVFDGDEPVSLLAAGPVRDGKFLVKAIDGKNPAQSFNWEVKAVRKDVAPLVVEPAKADVEVAGDGPYTYIKAWKKKP